MVTTLKVRKRIRRSQDERRRETRLRFIAATIDLINDKGYASLRSVDIAKKAGVTWGAAQHLFGNKDQLVIQVAIGAADDIIDVLEAGFAQAKSREERVVYIIDKIWEALSGKAYFTIVEILRGTRSAPVIHDQIVSCQVRIVDKIENLWERTLVDSKIDPEESHHLCHLVILYLSGLAARKIYFRPTTDAPKNIAYLKQLVLGALS